MKKMLMNCARIILVAYILFAPITLLAQVVTTGTADVNIMTMIADGQNIYGLAKAGSWLLFAQAIVMLICDLFKLKQLGGLFNKIPPRFRLTLPIVLRSIGGILLNVSTGTAVIDAIIGAFTIGASSAALRQAVVKMILGRDLNTGNSSPIG